MHIFKQNKLHRLSAFYSLVRTFPWCCALHESGGRRGKSGLLLLNLRTFQLSICKKVKSCLGSLSLHLRRRTPERFSLHTPQPWVLRKWCQHADASLLSTIQKHSYLEFVMHCATPHNHQSWVFYNEMRTEAKIRIAQQLAIVGEVLESMITAQMWVLMLIGLMPEQVLRLIWGLQVCPYLQRRQRQSLTKKWSRMSVLSMQPTRA